MDELNYDRKKITAGIIHFGVGNFHRAHMALYLDKLMEQGLAHDWGIIGAGITPYDIAMYENLKQQDWRTTIVEQDAETRTARVTASMIGFINPQDRAALQKQLSDPAIKIVSLTITEGGYCLDANGHFDKTNKDILHDATLPKTPKTIFAILINALKTRKDQGIKPFTIMSCDNIPHNGEVSKQVLVGLARLIDKPLADWILANVTFPSSMVDRITPATTKEQKQELLEKFGIKDHAPVFCEVFTQWVLEDNFCNGRPPLEKVNVTFVKDVIPYELMKIRILNGGHAAIAYPAGILGIHFVHDAMAHPLVSGFLEKLTREEIIPVVPPVPNVDLTEYAKTVAERFSNPRVGDTIRRLCLDGSNRQPKFIVPSIRDALAKGYSIEGLALESALWCRYCFGETEAGEKIEPNDPNWERLKTVAQYAKNHDAGAWLDIGEVYATIADDLKFREIFAKHLDNIWENSVEHCLKDYIEE